MILLLLTLVLFVASLPGYANGFVVNAPVDAPIEYMTLVSRLGAAVSIFSAIISLALAGVLFWRKSDDTMAVFVSFYLLGYGFVMAGPLEALEIVLHRQGELSIMAQTMLMTTPTFVLFFLFPNGKFVPRWTRYLTWVSLSIIPIVAFLGTPADWLTMKTQTTWATYLVMGLIFVAYINEIAKGVELLTGREVFDPTVYYFTEIPTMVMIH